MDSANTKIGTNNGLGIFGFRGKLVLITCPQQNQIAHAPSPPTLAENARMGHPQWEWCTERSLKVDHPPRFAVRV
jgi:hypothetical protein